MAESRYTRAVDEIDVTTESLNRALNAVRSEAEHPSKSQKPKMKRYKKVLLIAAVITVLFNVGVGTASAIMGVNLYVEVYRFFDESIDPKYVESYEGIVSVSREIKVEVTDAISDGYNLMVRLDITDPNHQINDSKDDYFGKSLGIGGVKLYDEFGNQYELSSVSGTGLTVERTQGMVLYFNNAPDFDREMHLYITQVNGVNGSWDMKFEVKPWMESKKYSCDTVIEFENGTKIRIDEVEQHLTCTVIKGTYLNLPDIEKGTVNDVKLSVGDDSYYQHSIESGEKDLMIRLEAIEGDLTESKLSITLGDKTRKKIELHLTEE